MIEAYVMMHELGYAHSVEAWNHEGELVGGLYGISLGSVFFGESMFSTQSNASKVAFCALVDECMQRHIQLIDCQVENPHLTSLGAIEIPREEFEEQLSSLIGTDEALSLNKGKWHSALTNNTNS